jgi:DNA-binding PadR family transcriptional regulator
VSTPDPQQAAFAFHETLLEVLRLLNQSAERRAEVEGMERIELQRAMRNFWAFRAGETDLERSLRLLMENGLVAENDHPQFAWDRGRVVRDRYAITALGKAYLVRQIEETGRIR